MKKQHYKIVNINKDIIGAPHQNGPGEKFILGVDFSSELFRLNTSIIINCGDTPAEVAIRLRELASNIEEGLKE